MAFLGTLNERDGRCLIVCKATGPNGGSVKAVCKAFGDVVSRRMASLSQDDGIVWLDVKAPPILRNRHEKRAQGLRRNRRHDFHNWNYLISPFASFLVK